MFVQEVVKSKRLSAEEPPALVVRSAVLAQRDEFEEVGSEEEEEDEGRGRGRTVQRRRMRRRRRKRG